MFCETVVLLSKGMVDSRKVKVDFFLEDMDLSEFKGKATYEQIKAYVLEQTELKVSSLYIAQIKKKCGLDVGENFNPADKLVENGGCKVGKGGMAFRQLQKPLRPSSRVLISG